MEVWDRDPSGVKRVRADNPSPLTLDGTYTYAPAAWVVDPGPADPAHLEAVRAAVDGPVEGVVLTHSHQRPLRGRRGARGSRDAAARGRGGRSLPALATPGHSSDSVCLVAGRVCFTGDTVLGRGSVFIAPGEGSLAAYLRSLERLRELDLEVLCPGHGPYVWDPPAKLASTSSTGSTASAGCSRPSTPGAARPDDLLDAAWADAPAHLRPAAAMSLAAHLEKLRDEGRLPDVEDPPQAATGSTARGAPPRRR